MKWPDVNYICHGLRAVVRFDGPDHPLQMKAVAGFISCPAPRAIATLECHDGSVFLPPDYAVTFIHPPMPDTLHL